MIGSEKDDADTYEQRVEREQHVQTGLSSDSSPSALMAEIEHLRDQLDMHEELQLDNDRLREQVVATALAAESEREHYGNLREEHSALRRRHARLEQAARAFLARWRDVLGGPTQSALEEALELEDSSEEDTTE